MLSLISLYSIANCYTHNGCDVTINNFKNTQNPIRFSKLKINYNLSDFDFKSTTALEYKWNDDTSIESTSINFREYYVSYYPSFGEINIGKQIVSWGFADGNNPTDNINPIK